ncbi:MAG: helix-turn-helix transcriptional regulator [Pseudomonadota bacterium]
MKNDTEFYKNLGTRIAELRKEIELTQTQLAQHLEISQQHMASFEKGIRKIPAAMLPTLSQLFGLSVDELLGITQSKKRGLSAKLQQQLERAQALPRGKQQLVYDMLDVVIKKQQKDS